MPEITLEGRNKVAGILLAGGRSRRFGKDKALALIDGETLLLRSIRKLKDACDEVIIVSPDGMCYPDCGAREIPDLYPGLGPLGGILTGLRGAGHEYCFFAACDMPFWRSGIVGRLFSAAIGWDGAVPRNEGGLPEPLLAVYSTRCADPIEERIRANDLKVSSFFGRVRINYILVSELTEAADGYSPFTNVNTQEDYRSLPGRTNREES